MIEQGTARAGDKQVFWNGARIVDFIAGESWHRRPSIAAGLQPPSGSLH